jgi:serine/threonine-protein kinase HipA
MKRLTVYLNRDEVGTLTQDDSGLLGFSYKQEWAQRSDASPLSRSLPLQVEAFRGKQARSFFAGILPEEGPRKRIAAILGISERNDFAMLERIGGECAGAVSVLPEGSTPPAPGATGTRELSEKELREILGSLPDRPLLAGEEGVRLSLAGAQDKLPVVVRGSRISLPLGGAPSTHIIKPEPDRFPGLAANEFLCMSLAKAVGMNVTPVELRPVGDKPCILVQRYDRMVNDDGTVVRLHQEDFCQALGFPPERKYQQEGGPLLKDCIALLREWSTTPVLDLRGFIDGQILNVLIGNADSHGKNYSMLYRGRERRLAPFYDLVCTLAWPELSKRPAMKIGKADSVESITLAHWQAMAQETQLGWPMIRARMAELSRKVLVALDTGAGRRLLVGSSMAAQVAAITTQRAKAMLASPTA